MPDGFNSQIAGQTLVATHRTDARSSEEAETSPAAPIETGLLFDATNRLTETSVSTKPTWASSPSEPIAAKRKAKPQQKGANRGSKPTCPALSSVTIRDHTPCDTQRVPVPSSEAPQAPAAPIGQASNGAAGDEGQSRSETPTCVALVASVNRIVELQRMRRFCIKSQSRCDRSIESLIASYLGYSTDLEEKNRKALFRRAGEIRKRVENGGGDHTGDDTQGRLVPAVIYPMILASAQARSVWDDQRKIAEKEMERLARALPVWPWVEGVRGLGAKGLAILVGEAGIPIGDYRTVSGLWSRLGLAVIDGERQQRKGGELGKVHKFSPGRRAEVWAVASDSLFRAQWRGANDETGEPAHPIGPYGEVYARRRELTVERMERTANLPSDDRDKWSKGRCHNDARRIMTKELVKDLWVEWRRAVAA